MYVQDFIGHTMTDNATAAVAASAVASPLWLPTLHDASAIAATIAPILGAIWLVVQIWGKVVEIRVKLKESKINED
jgi:hypothetical protein